MKDLDGIMDEQFKPFGKKLVERLQHKKCEVKDLCYTICSGCNGYNYDCIKYTPNQNDKYNSKRK